jgi:hypothetical protein
METVCHNQLRFESLFPKEVVADLAGGRITSDAGGLVLRGEVENRIKELKLEIKAHRLSCHRFLANQFRLLLHTAAYCLFWLLRHHLRGSFHLLSAPSLPSSPPKQSLERRPSSLS